MLAVVKISGQQYKVQAGQSLYVPHLEGKTGDKVEFNDVIFVDNNGSISFTSKVTVKAEILNAKCFSMVRSNFSRCKKNRCAKVEHG